MIIERDGLTYVPLTTFSRLSGVDYWKVKSSIENGIIHHSYVLKIRIEEQSFKYRTFIREDKAKDYGKFMEDYRTTTEMAQICRDWYGIKVDGHKFAEMIGQGYIPNEWCVFVYPNGNSRVVYLLVEKSNIIARTYLIYIEEEEKREQKGFRVGTRMLEIPQPENAVLFKPNPECEGFMLTPEQVELLKLFRKYRENKEPLF